MTQHPQAMHKKATHLIEMHVSGYPHQQVTAW